MGPEGPAVRLVAAAKVVGEEDGVRSAFGACGQVVEVKMITDRETGQPRGFAFVTMGDEKSAQAAISQLNGSNLDGRSLRVNEAEPREQRGGGGGGGGRNRW